MHKISDNVAKVQSRIQKAEQEYHREPGSVQLIAVSKTKPFTDIRTAYACGLTHFAENYVQEALDKIEKLKDLAITWHFIGPIQSNKTRIIAENFSWIHSLDRYKIAHRLSEQRPVALPPLQVCLQVNISEEESKSGIAPNELEDIYRQIADLPNLTVRGLMAIPEPCADFDKQRKIFAELAAYLRELAALQKTQAKLDTLSIGMSADLEAAIAAGSTMVRIGTDIFGART